MLDEDGRQAASAECGVDHGVIENPLITAIGEIGETDGFSLNGNGVLAVLRADCGLRAGLVCSHVFPFVAPAVEAATGW